MSTAMNRRHRKRCKALTTRELRTLIQTLAPEVRMAVSLLECAKQELAKRPKIEPEGES
ncbi:hypothetical protein [Pseudoxanthomonas jiangsuensis]|uniref:hypothetical protein n=1 Tax=Pseudoxanthomonas jiangsuensis TaxID=619688 RepID=UPI0013918680|nr:hypothetical protein [Pseudoxanthomonas jiangsuensis]